MANHEVIAVSIAQSQIGFDIAALRGRRARACQEFARRCTAGSGPSPRDAAAFGETLARIDAQVELLEGLVPRRST